MLATRTRSGEPDAPEGSLRRDLYYRLATFRLKLPALRERLEDLPALLALFLARRAGADAEPAPRVAPEALVELGAHPWPGNVRELGAVATRLWLDRPTEISAEHARRALGDASPARAEVTAEARVHAALKTAKGNKSEAARLLGVSRGTLYKRLRELGLEG